MLAAWVNLVDGGTEHVALVISARRADQVAVALAGAPGVVSHHSGVVEHDLVTVPAWAHPPMVYPGGGAPWELVLAYAEAADAAGDLLGRLSPTTLASPIALDDGVWGMFAIGLDADSGAVLYT
jgi:hypothetical protein